MVQFNELLISPDAKSMIIDVSIPSEDYYKDVYLDSVLIDNQDTYVGTGVSSTPVYTYLVPTTQQLKYKKGTTEYKTKHLRLVINAEELTQGTFDGIFFVYVRTKGTYGAGTPCGCDEITTLASVTNLKPFYDTTMSYIRELGNTCEIPKGFINQLLRTKAIETAIRTRNYTEAVNLWKDYRGTSTNIKRGGCGCRGAS